MVAEVEHHTKAFGVTDIEFEDDIFNFDPKRVLKICDLILKRNLKLRIGFGNGVRTDVLTEEVVEALVGAGLRFSAFALESGSPRVQQFMGKQLNIDKFLRGVKWATDRGVFAHGFAMLGFPTETEEDMKTTLDVACNSRLHTAAFFTVVPYQGTELYSYVEKNAPDKLKGSAYGDLEFIRNRINLSEVAGRGPVPLSTGGIPPVLPESHPHGADCARLSESLVSSVLSADVYRSRHQATFCLSMNLIGDKTLSAIWIVVCFSRRLKREGFAV